VPEKVPKKEFAFHSPDRTVTKKSNQEGPVHGCRFSAGLIEHDRGGSRNLTAWSPLAVHRFRKTRNPANPNGRCRKEKKQRGAGAQVEGDAAEKYFWDRPSGIAQGGKESPQISQEMWLQVFATPNGNR